MQANAKDRRKDRSLERGMVVQLQSPQVNAKLVYCEVLHVQLGFLEKKT